MKIKKAIIPAGGIGSRLRPLTYAIPKELLPIGNVPIIDYILQECSLSGMEEIIFVLSDNKSNLFNYLYKTQNIGFKKDLRFCFVPQIPTYGTASAVLSCESILKNEDFAVVFPDELYFDDAPALLQLCEKYYENGKSVLGTFSVKKENCSSYGIIKSHRIGDENKVEQIIEKPKTDPPSLNALSGRFILKNDVFPYLRKIEQNNNEYYLTDALSLYIKEHVLLEQPIIGKRFDCGQKEGYLNVIKSPYIDICE